MEVSDRHFSWVLPTVVGGVGDRGRKGGYVYVIESPSLPLIGKKYLVLKTIPGYHPYLLSGSLIIHLKYPEYIYQYGMVSPPYPGGGQEPICTTEQVRSFIERNYKNRNE